MQITELARAFQHLSLSELEAFTMELRYMCRCKANNLNVGPPVTNVSVDGEEVFKMIESIPGYDAWKTRSDIDDAAIYADGDEVEHCDICGEELDTEGLCPSCNPESYACPECGADIPVDDTMCEECGWTADPEETEDDV